MTAVDSLRLPLFLIRPMNPDDLRPTTELQLHSELAVDPTNPHMITLTIHNSNTSISTRFAHASLLAAIDDPPSKTKPAVAVSPDVHLIEVMSDSRGDPSGLTLTIAPNGFQPLSLSVSLLSEVILFLTGLENRQL